MFWNLVFTAFVLSLLWILRKIVSCLKSILWYTYVLRNCTRIFCSSDMDVELASVITAVSKNKSIKHFHMGRNIVNVKAKHISTIMDALVQMIQVCFVPLNGIISRCKNNKRNMHRRKIAFYKHYPFLIVS